MNMDNPHILANASTVGEIEFYRRSIEDNYGIDAGCLTLLSAISLLVNNGDKLPEVIGSGMVADRFVNSVLNHKFAPLLRHLSLFSIERKPVVGITIGDELVDHYQFEVVDTVTKTIQRYLICQTTTESLETGVFINNESAIAILLFKVFAVREVALNDIFH